jgi:hypothetical protein
LHLSFEDESLRDACVSSAHARQQFGDDIATSLQSRLADLDAAANLAELAMVGFQVEGREIFSLRLIQGAKLHFSSTHTPMPKKSDGEIDLSKVWRVKILRIDLGQ